MGADQSSENREVPVVVRPETGGRWCGQSCEPKLSVCCLHNSAHPFLAKKRPGAPVFGHCPISIYQGRVPRCSGIFRRRWSFRPTQPRNSGNNTIKKYTKTLQKFPIPKFLKTFLKPKKRQKGDGGVFCTRLHTTQLGRFCRGRGSRIDDPINTR